MKAKSIQDISSQLTNLNWLQECIILEIRWLNYGYLLEIDFNTIWDIDGNLRSNLDETKLITLKMAGVQRILFNHSFSNDQLQNPQLMNWGMNEISRISVELSHDLSKETGWQFYHFHIHWEQKRAINIICLDLEIIGGNEIFQ